MARRCESNRLCPNTASAVQNPERSIRKLRFQEMVKYLRLTTNRPIPVLEDQVVAGRKRFIEVENFVIQNASLFLKRPRSLFNAFILS